jgi:hypothetical protein
MIKIAAIAGIVGIGVWASGIAATVAEIAAQVLGIFPIAGLP